MTTNEPKIWILADDRAGNRSQVFGVKICLNKAVEIKNLAYRPLAKLPNALMPLSFAILDDASQKSLIEPWPDLVIAAGRRTAGIARRIKTLSYGATRIVQIMGPGGSTKDFDLICLPKHDRDINGQNIMRITGAPHSLTPNILTSARKQWMPRLSELNSPRIALIIGGSTRRRRFTSAMAKSLAVKASTMANKSNGSLLVVTSPRTAGIADEVINALNAPSRVYKWGDSEENPYAGYVACADIIIVTGDSISMCTEACASTVPVYLFAPSGLVSSKHARFHRSLFKAGYAQDLFSGKEAQSHPPLNPGIEISEAIRRLMDW